MDQTILNHVLPTVMLSPSLEMSLPDFGEMSARQWLVRYGVPYIANAFDADGRVGIDWGVYGTPETFIVDQQGVIRHKHIGPLTREVVRDKILPLVQQLEASSG